MNRSRRLMVKGLLVLGMATAALLVPRPGAVLGACDTVSHCIDNCGNVPANYEGICQACAQGVDCLFHPGGFCPEGESGDFQYFCNYLS